ncbi:hypothetical protein [Paracoccus alcaliphilus]|uniref:hypothetical protein n=1 Tax=Paracoccus alcaliphilus TaxID=34002 RepID=UPI0011134E5A|nr:hypothetical protein [Paracoccus alcaliphilus]WCR17505.1 hypothetical protein JHW40_14375 [Paracoccus alcaliphilus]
MGRSYKLRRRANVLRVVGGDVTVNDLTGLSASLSSRRVASIWIVNFSGTTFPSGTDTVIQRQNNSFSIWVSTGSQPDPLDPAVHQQDATGQWWIRAWDSGTAAQQLADLRTEVRDGRVYYASADTDPSGSDIPTWADFVTTGHNASGTTRDWRPRGAPEDGLETDNVKLDANGRWWARMRDAAVGNAIRDGGIITTVNIGGTGDAITADIAPSFIEAGITSLGGASVIEYIPVATNTGNSPTLAIGGQTFGIRNADGSAWPADSFVVGRSYELRRRGGNLRVANGDATSVELAALSFLIGGKADITNSGKVFSSREGAVNAGQDNLAPALGRVLTFEGDWVNVRGPNAGNDPLFEGYPTWGILDRIPTYRVIDALIADVLERATREELNEAISTEARERIEAIAELDGNQWPGDDSIVVDAVNGAALVTKGDGITRGTFSADDVFAGDYQDMLRAGEAGEVRQRLLNDGWPGDEDAVLVEAVNGPAVVVTGEGDMKATLLLREPEWPGDWIAEELVDARGVVLRGIDVRDGSPYGQADALSSWPGDWIIPAYESLNNVVLFGFDARDGSPYGLGTGPNPGPNPDPDGSGVKFVDPEFTGDVFGAVEDANGTIKFLTRLADGEMLGLEKRNGIFFADTQQLAIAVLAFGGGETGFESSLEEHRWHVFDETLEPQDMGTAANGLAAAYLSKQHREARERSIMFPIAEVISSTTEADALAGSPRRQQIIERVQSAVASAETIGKTLMAAWIKLSLLSGAPATPFATAREHYGMVGNGLRLDVAEATGQGAAPLLLVNQSIGTRADGTSEVILAEGRLDWDFYSVGFVVPTPLYPYPLEPGTLATPTRDARLLIREIETLALAELGQGREWFCPSLEEATIDGSTITARCATMSPLVIRDPANHGFSFAEAGAPAISGVSVSGSYATITLASAPTGPLTLQYAFGQTGDPGDGFAANRGSLTDEWEHVSLHVPGNILHRYARSGRVNVQ